MPIEEQVKIGAETLTNDLKLKNSCLIFRLIQTPISLYLELETIYKSALTHPDVIGLSIGTRPDCVDEDKLNLISDIGKDYYTWVEYGLQSIHDKTLLKINRGHDFDCF